MIIRIKNEAANESVNSEKNEMIKNIGLCSVTFRRLGTEEIIEAAAKNGLGCIEWGGDIHVPPQDFVRAKQIGEFTRGAGLACPSYGSYFRCDDPEKFKPVAEVAAALGADVVRVWAGEKDSEAFDGAEFEKLVEVVSECAEIADRAGLKLAFEYHHGTYCDNPESVKKLLVAVAKKNVGTYWQPAYWLGEVSESERIEANLRTIETLKEDIVNVHVYHWKASQRLALSEGKEEWEKYTARLSLNSRYYLEFVQGDEMECFRRDAETLRAIAERSAKREK